MDLQEARTQVGAGWYTVLNKLDRAKPAGCVITGVSRVDGRLHITATGITPCSAPIPGWRKMSRPGHARTAATTAGTGGR